MPAGPVEFVGDGTDGGPLDRVDAAVEQAGFDAVFGDEFGDILSGCLEFMALGAGNVLLADKHGDNAARPFVMQSLDPVFLGQARQCGGNESLGHRLLGCSEHIVYVAGFDHASGAHYGHAAGNLLDHVHLMGDKHNGDAEFLVHTLEQGQHFGGGFRVERAGGFVGEQNLRISGQCAGDADALLLAAGQLRRVFVCVLTEAHEFKEFVDTTILIVLAPVIELQWVGDVLGHGFGGEQVELLENHADFLADGPQLGLTQRGDISTKHGHSAGGGSFERVDKPDQCGFACTGIADDAEDVTAIDGQADVIHGSCDVRAASACFEFLHDMVEGDDGVAHSAP